MFVNEQGKLNRLKLDYFLDQFTSQNILTENTTRFLARPRSCTVASAATSPASCGTRTTSPTLGPWVLRVLYLFCTQRISPSSSSTWPRLTKDITSASGLTGNRFQDLLCFYFSRYNFKLKCWIQKLLFIIGTFKYKSVFKAHQRMIISFETTGLR